MANRHNVNILLCMITLLLFRIPISSEAFARTADDSTSAVIACASDWAGHSDSIKMRSILRLQVENLDKFLQQSKSPSKKPVLFLNEMPLKGLYPVAVDPTAMTISFQLVHTDDAMPTWRLLHQFRKPSKEVDISVGWEDGYPIKTAVTKTLVLYSENALAWSIGLLVMFVAFFALLAIQTDIIRDSGPIPPPGQRNTFSLGQFQMAWWFLIVLAATTIVGIVTGELPAFPASVLTLLGIASGTALGSAVISAGKPDTSPPMQYAALVSASEQLRKSVAANPDNTALKVQLQENSDKMKALEPNVFSSGFLNDILSDSGGINFHRFQVFIWTIFFGIVFLTAVVTTMVLKDFDSTWLALMGISSGTYVGFKIPAQRQ